MAFLSANPWMSSKFHCCQAQTDTKKHPDTDTMKTSISIMWPLQEQQKKHFLLEDSETDEGDFKDKNQPTQTSQSFAQV